MCFDRSGGHAPPATRRLFPDSAERSVRLFRFPSRHGQRASPLSARPLDEPRRQVEPVERHVLHAVGVQQRRRILPEHRPEGVRGRREAERAFGARSSRATWPAPGPQGTACRSGGQEDDRVRSRACGQGRDGIGYQPYSRFWDAGPTRFGSGATPTFSTLPERLSRHYQ